MIDVSLVEPWIYELDPITRPSQLKGIVMRLDPGQHKCFLFKGQAVNNLEGTLVWSVPNGLLDPDLGLRQALLDIFGLVEHSVVDQTTYFKEQ